MDLLLDYNLMAVPLDNSPSEMVGRMTDGFEIIDASEFEAATKATPRARKTKSVDDLERTKSNWFSLPTSLGECTIPEHEEVQSLLSELAKAYREEYGRVRMVLRREGNVCICRDCWINGY